MVEKPPVASRGKRNLLIGIGAVCAPLLWISLMIWSPLALELSGKIVKPIQAFLDHAVTGRLGSVVLVLVWPLLVPAIAIHELGHLFAGLCAGFSLVRIRVGPVHFSPPFKIYLKNEPKTGASGMVFMVPRTIESLRSRALLFVVGGPTANFISAYLVIHFSGRDQIAILFAGLSILLGIGNLVPFQKLYMISDGKLIAKLLFNTAQGERSLALLQLMAELQKGVEYKDMSPAFIAKAIAIKDNSSETVAGHLFAYAAVYDSANTEEAAELFEVCLAYSMFVSPSVREVLRADAAVFLARKRKRVDLAEQWLSEIPEKTFVPGLHKRAQAAILEAQGNIEEALEKLAEVEIELRSIPDPFQRSLSLKSMQKWKLELESMKHRSLFNMSGR